MAIKTLLGLTAFISAAPPTSAPQPTPRTTTRLGIFYIAVVGLEPALGKTAIDALATAAGGVEGYHVVTRSELDALLGAEQLKDAAGCDDVSCLAEIGMAAGVARIVAGSLSRVDRGLVVSLQLINVQYANVENRVSLEWPGDTTGLSDLLGAAVDLLLITGRERRPGGLRISGVPAGAVVSVDGEPRGVGPTEVTGLAVGTHGVRIEAEGFEPHHMTVVVRHGAIKHVDIALTPLPPTPFYGQWWFWTGTGAVAVAGGIVAVLLAQRDGGDGTAGAAEPRGTLVLEGPLP